MSSARSPLLLLLFWGAFALWGPLLAVSRLSKPDCTSVPTYFQRCRFPKERYFYNVNSKRCQLFLDYGCPGSRNTYDSLRKCQQACAEIDVCQLPPEHGPCDDKLRRWFYDPKTQSCETFIFGGCGGNANHFRTRWRCQLTCPKQEGSSLLADGRRTPTEMDPNLCAKNPLCSTLMLDPNEGTGLLDKRRRRTLDLIGTLSILRDKKTPAPPSG